LLVPAAPLLTSILRTTRWLQDVFDVPLVIMMTDDEKIIFGKKAFSLEEMRKFTRANATDILAVGFDIKKTFLFSDFGFMGGSFYENVVKVSRQITCNQSRAVFGFSERFAGETPHSSRSLA
jgi:tryptophanyl-tRNA synthetase